MSVHESASRMVEFAFDPADAHITSDVAVLVTTLKGHIVRGLIEVAGQLRVLIEEPVKRQSVQTYFKSESTDGLREVSEDVQSVPFEKQTLSIIVTGSMEPLYNASYLGSFVREGSTVTGHDEGPTVFHVWTVPMMVGQMGYIHDVMVYKTTEV